MSHAVVKPLTFTKAQHLRRPWEFEKVYAAKIAKRVGPLRVHGVPNSLAHSRLGLSVSTRVGGAVRRNRVKRLLRESFRLSQYDLPTGYDWVVVVLPHPPAALEDYRRMFADAAKKLAAHWSKRPAAPDAPPEPSPDA